ncbi:MAG: TerB family tellurite resistance protein, partial [Rhodothermales bacterium]
MTIQSDLALIYIALAHSTDQDLSGPEVEAISKRLRAWQTHATEETVLSAIKNALGVYTEATAKEEVERAVQRIRTEIEQDLRQTIVDDLVEIALADNRFLHEEGSMIGQLARAWEVHIEENQHGSWTVL